MIGVSTEFGHPFVIAYGKRRKSAGGVVVTEQKTVAVLAHGMLTSLSVVRASLWLTATSEDGDVRERVMTHGIEELTLITDILTGLVEGLSPEALELLHEVRSDDGNRELGHCSNCQALP